LPVAPVAVAPEAGFAEIAAVVGRTVPGIFP